MYDDDQMENQDQYFTSFQIMINQDQMVSSYVVEEQKIKFLKQGIVVDENGIKELSDPNKQFNKIKIDPKQLIQRQTLGRGSAGEVKRATNTINGKQYSFAIKSINATQQDNRKQLLNDLRSYLSGQPSEFLIEFYTCFFKNGLVKQVIEYMDLGDLRNIINLIIKKKLTISEEEIATIIYKILRGLDYIHNYKHSIHRDIKPQNILINSKGEVKITDFGVSKCIEHSSGKSVVGTVTYMSPERFSLNNQSSYTYKCDIWSLGLLLYELASGKPIPYIETGSKFNYFKVSENILNYAPPQLQPGFYSPQMCDFLKNCLQKDENLRGSASTLLQHVWIKQKVGSTNLRQLMQRMQSVL